MTTRTKKTTTSKTKKMRVSEIAFLFSSDNDKTKSFVKGQSVYISPHTIQLLETARANHHQWYVFLDDVFPLVSMFKFKQFLQELSKDKKVT